MNASPERLPETPELVSRMKALGFSSCGLLTRQEFSSVSEDSALREAAEQGMESLLIAAFPVVLREPGGREDQSSPEDPHGLLAPFARRNHYARAVFLLQQLAREIRIAGGFRRRDFRIFSNSRLPEHLLARRAGLGISGKNTLLITPRRGTRVILAGILLPYGPVGNPPGPEEVLPCGTCDRCIRACPTGALSEEGGLDRNRCLQALSTGAMPAEFRRAWKTRIYGCRICQEACPRNAGLDKEAPEETPGIPDDFPGYLGPSLSLRGLLRAGDRVKEGLKGSVLDQGWITREAILRNALVAAGNHPDGRVLRPEVEAFRRHPLLGEAAVRALELLD